MREQAPEYHVIKITRRLMVNCTEDEGNGFYVVDIEVI